MTIAETDLLGPTLLVHDWDVHEHYIIEHPRCGFTVSSRRQPRLQAPVIQVRPHPGMPDCDDQDVRAHLTRLRLSTEDAHGHRAKVECRISLPTTSLLAGKRPHVLLALDLHDTDPATGALRRAPGVPLALRLDLDDNLGIVMALAEADVFLLADAEDPDGTIVWVQSLPHRRFQQTVNLARVFSGEGVLRYR